MPEQLFHQVLSFQALEVLELIDQSGATPIEADGALGIGTAPQSRTRSANTRPPASSSAIRSGIWPAAWVLQLRQGSKQRMPASTRLSRDSGISAPSASGAGPS